MQECRAICHGIKATCRRLGRKNKLEMGESTKKRNYAASYFGVVSIRQGMRWVQVAMLFMSFVNFFPAVFEAGYECDMSYSNSATSIGAFSQVFCWMDETIRVWRVCKLSAGVTFANELLNQVSLLFGLLLISSPKPSVGYVKAVRYLTMLSFFEALVKFAYHLCVVIDGAAFIRSSVSCVTGLEVLAAPDYVSDSTKDMAFSIFGIACYTAFIWGTYALVDVLQKGGTGDEKVAEDDVLALVKTSPTKLLVLSSAFGFAGLRPGVLILCCVTLGMSFFHAFNNIYRMTNWCGQMAFENHWCIWPFGSVTAADQLLCGVISLVSIQALVSMRSNTELKLVKYFWFMFSLTSFGGMLWSFYIILDKYPSFWMNGMRTDFWLYYGRFWIAILIGIFMHSISVIRVAGGVGWESESDAKEIIYSKLNEDVVGDRKINSLSDLLGMDIPIQEDAKVEGVMRSRESSSAGTPG
jgi:hypothetical protein